MAANTAQIFSRAPDIQWQSNIAVANTTLDLTSGTIYLIAVADATNGGRFAKMVFQPLGTNVATAARIWINNGGATGTLANNVMYKDVTLPATTVSQVAAIGNTEVPLDLALPAGYRLYVTIGTALATGVAAVAVGGKY